MNEHKLTSYKCDEHKYNDRWKIALFKPFYWEAAIYQPR